MNATCAPRNSNKIRVSTQPGWLRADISRGRGGIPAPLAPDFPEAGRVRALLPPLGSSLSRCSSQLLLPRAKGVGSSLAASALAGEGPTSVAAEGVPLFL